MDGNDQLLDEALCAEVLSLAHRRLLQDPHDIIVRFAFSCALSQLCQKEVAARIRQDLASRNGDVAAVMGQTIAEGKSKVDTPKGGEPSAQPMREGGVASPLKCTDTSEDIVMEDDTKEGLPPEFLTTTIARLFLEQGHLDTCSEILQKIIDSDANNKEAQAMLASLPRASSQRASQIGRLNIFLSQLERKGTTS